MSFNVGSIPKQLFDAARQRAIVPLVGAGVSRQSGGTFPTWPELLQQMNAEAEKNGYVNPGEAKELQQLISRGQYLMVAEALRASFPIDEFETFLETVFDPPDIKPAEVHRALFDLKPPVIVTTNYDTLLEDAYAATYHQAATVYTYRDAPVMQRHLQKSRAPHRPVIFKIHGSVDEPAEIVLSERDYRNLLYHNPGYRTVLSAIFITTAVVMIGFSFKDRELTLLLESIRDSLKHRSSPDYLLLSAVEVGAVEAKRMREDFGIHVIRYDPEPGHPELLQFVKALAAEVQKSA